MKKDRLDFFVLEGTEQARDIEKIMESLDNNKGEYKIYYLENKKDCSKFPMLKVTFATGECTEYEENKMFNIILNYVKIGKKLPNK